MHPMRAAIRFQWSRACSTWGAGSENAYTILGLQRECSTENIRAAFRELAKATHPDKQRNLSGSTSSAHFVRVLAAYQILADPRKRALYDAQLGAQEKSQQRKEEFYQRQNSHKRRGGFNQSEAGGGFADRSETINQDERQEFVCPETEVAEWLRHYRSAMTSAVHRREIGIGGGILEGVRGELGSALRKAYHGPPVYEEEGIPSCFEAEERAQPRVRDILQLVSGHNLFGFVRVLQQPMLENLQSHMKAIDGRTGGVDTPRYVSSSNHHTLGHSRSMHNDAGKEDVESEYVDLELQVFEKVIARSSRVQPKMDGSSTSGSRSRDCIYVYSIPAQDSEDQRWSSNTGSDLIGTIHGLEDLVCAVHGPDGKLTHRIMQHQSPLVKHMAWFKASGSCECRRRRASLLPSRYWIFAPRSATHNVGGWYIETWSSQIVRTRDEYGIVRQSDQEDLRLNPAMYIFAAAYKTLDEEAAQRRKLFKFIEFTSMVSTFTLWCRNKLKLS